MNDKDEDGSADIEWRYLTNTGASTVRAAHWEVDARGTLIFYNRAHVPIEAAEPGTWEHVEAWSRTMN